MRSAGFKTDACKNEMLRIRNQVIKNRQDFVLTGVGFKPDESDQSLYGAGHLESTGF